MNVNIAYIPKDRQKSIAHQKPLPEHTYGTAVFADISGFTALTEGLAKALGMRRGAEELAKRLNHVYHVLINEIHAYGGSVIGFSGDAVTCWFDDLDGNAAVRGVACGLALQDVIEQFKSIRVPTGEVLELGLRVGIASGSARRFLVGNPKTQVLDTLVGETIDRMVTAQEIADIGDVIIDKATQETLGERVNVLALSNADMSDFGVVQKNTGEALAKPQMPLQYKLSDEEIRVWIQPAVYKWLTQGHDDFLTELRPATALFIGFDGIDYESDPQAGNKLNDFIQKVQSILEQYEGTFMQLTIGDKGSYLYAAFGAPIAHEDNESRAVYSALSIQKSAKLLGFIKHLRMGITHGTMRTGPYGSQTRRTYGVLGDEVNIAARLMQHTQYDSIAGSGYIQEKTSQWFKWASLEPIKVKGKSEPMPIALLDGVHLDKLENKSDFTLPMVGREKELAIIKDKLTQAITTSGQVIGIVAEAGMGKSRLVREVVNLAHKHGLESSTLVSECPSYGTKTSYLVWQSLLQQFFKLDTMPTVEIPQYLTQLVESIDALQLQNLPLLDTIFNVDLSPSEYTKQLNGETRRNLRHALLCAMMEAQKNPHVIILEDTHWLDTLSYELLESILQHIKDMPILLVMVYRPTTEHNSFSSIEALANFTQISLDSLTESETTKLIQNKLSHQNVDETVTIPEALVSRVLERAQGNPFYIEELITYINDQNISLDSILTNGDAVLPNSLHSLILSRIDRLTEQQKVTLKVASIIGRIFSFSWLYGYYPSLGKAEQLKNILHNLARLDLTPIDTPDPHLTYFFKHILTQEVTYESLSYDMRLQLHEKFASYLEDSQDSASYLGLITYHYERSSNVTKKFHYFVEAGADALELYALDNAIDYFDKAFSLIDGVIDEIDMEELETLFVSRGRSFEYLGRHQDAVENYQVMASFATQGKHSTMVLTAEIREATLYSTLTNVSDTAKGQKMSEETLAKARESNNLKAEVESLWNLLNNFRLQGDLDQSVFYGEQALKQAQILNDDGLMGFVLGDLGNVYIAQGSLTRGIETATKSQHRWEDLDNRAMLTDSLGAIAQCLVFRGDFDDAIEVGNEGNRISQLIGNLWGETYCHISVGFAFFYLGMYQRALAILLNVEALGQQSNLPIASVFGIQFLARVYQAIGDYDQAILLSELGVERANEQMPAFASQMQITLLLIYINSGNMDKANDLFSKIPESTSPWIPYPKFMWMEAKCRLMAHQGQADEAIELLKAFLEDERETELHPSYTETLIALSHLQATHGYDNQKAFLEASERVEKLNSAHLRNRLNASNAGFSE